jgi:sugar/nucleoside kinase (ribokinase family)
LCQRNRSKLFVIYTFILKILIYNLYIFNYKKAEIITGIQNLTVSNAQKVIDKLFSLGCNTVIITFGAQGAVHATQQDKKYIHTPTENVKAVDTTVRNIL